VAVLTFQKFHKETCFSERVTRQLERDTSALGCEWWETDSAGVLVDVARSPAFLLAFVGITEAIQETKDPLWVVGSTTAAAAHAVAWEWLDAGVEPSEVRDWLRAGCWDPVVARALVDIGVDVERLLDVEGRPCVWVEIPSGERLPVAAALADKHINIEEAAQAVRVAL
jgi:hypothetical protein